jgi:divinyl protochlorophyllide a 8-vinyl-reductase
MTAAAVAGTSGRIGPNAITRLAEALDLQIGHRFTMELFSLAGLATYLERPPTTMIDEAEARRLHSLVRERLDERIADEVSRAAGVATANYLLANRIPKPVQRLLKALPARLACRLLLKAIERHAWTFAGSGHFEARAGQHALLTIRDNPLCRGQHSTYPVCSYYAATFERLFIVLVHRKATVTELSCEARGDDACRFEVRWAD